MKLRSRFLLLFIMYSAISYAQDNKMDSRHSLDIQMLGNKGFFSAGYNRTFLETKLLTFVISPSVGYTFGSHDTAFGGTPFPSFTHLNIGTNIILGDSYNRFSAGISYTKIMLGNNSTHVRPRSNYDRVLGDVAYIRHIKHDQLALKLAFTPILFDNGADDIENIPIAFTFRIML